ncbi:hypothetical protein [uncultured Paludibaculum sp.]|uniref:hypothetical protein n=1 Tax=uncultured Paludibaculum sp. TaxID=1765020 RepID=UPI002AAA7637|nr:hypothetical protein [uncultured Paludibaculum sp.]
MNTLLLTTPSPSLDPSTLPSGANMDQQHRKETASQFEALLIGQIMRSMRESSGGGWLGSGEEQSGSALGEFAEQHLSQIIAQQGGFGLASLIEQGLTTGATSPPATASQSAAASLPPKL